MTKPNNTTTMTMTMTMKAKCSMMNVGLVGLVGLGALGSSACRDDPPATPAGTSTGPGPTSTTAVDGTATLGGADVPPDVAAPVPVCDDYDPARNLYWGDLHVHTAYSFDAWLHDVRLDPDDAYRFAQGEAVALPPLDERGQPDPEIRPSSDFGPSEGR